MQIKPLGDRVLVKPITEEERTKAGILLPETSEKEKKEQGQVVSVGDGDKVKKLNLRPGDKILFGKYAGEEIKIDKVNYKFLKDEDILGIVE